MRGHIQTEGTLFFGKLMERVDPLDSMPGLFGFFLTNLRKVVRRENKAKGQRRVLLLPTVLAMAYRYCVENKVMYHDKYMWINQLVIFSKQHQYIVYQTINIFGWIIHRLYNTIFLGVDKLFFSCSTFSSVVTTRAKLSGLKKCGCMRSYLIMHIIQPLKI